MPQEVRNKGLLQYTFLQLLLQSIIQAAHTLDNTNTALIAVILWKSSVISETLNIYV